MSAFQKMGILGRYRTEHLSDTLLALIQFLEAQKQAFLLDEDLKSLITEKQVPAANKLAIAKACDLLIVIGGDGSLLQAAKIAAESQTPVIGINKGRLGFLTDILPSDLEKKLKPVLEGHYLEERRFLVDVAIKQAEKEVYKSIALNDVVLLPGDVAHMIEFEIYINQQFVCKQRADGLIVATPTGSTAYALSGGGPILHPQLEALVLVPMFPHTLSSRPLVVESSAVIDIVISAQNETSPWLSCDGQEKKAVSPGTQISIQKKQALLRLIHPEHYNYYETLRSKLHWSGRFDT